jgi:hypothetical protein
MAAASSLRVDMEACLGDLEATVLAHPTLAEVRSDALSETLTGPRPRALILEAERGPRMKPRAPGAPFEH